MALNFHRPNKNRLPALSLSSSHSHSLFPFRSVRASVLEIQYLHFTIYFNTYTPHCTNSCRAVSMLFVTFYQFVMHTICSCSCSCCCCCCVWTPSTIFGICMFCMSFNPYPKLQMIYSIRH